MGAFATLTALKDKTGAGYRTGEGRKSIALPAFSPAATEHNVTLPGCSGCSKSATHVPCSHIAVQMEHGEAIHARVPLAQRVDRASILKAWQALFVAKYIARAVVKRVNYTTSGRDNIAQQIDFELVSVNPSGLGNDWIRLRGPNPKRLGGSYQMPNPDWPGEGGRYTSIGYTYALDVGSSVEFRSPSALSGKLYPFIREVSPPASDDDTTEFNVRLSCSAVGADEPEDAAYPAESYGVTIRSYQRTPEHWPNFQPRVEAQFSAKSFTMTASEIAALATPGLVPLTDNDGGATRVIYPDMFPGAFSAIIETSSGVTVLSDVEARARLRTVQSGGGWTTTLDLRAIDSLPSLIPTLVSLFVAYRPEAVSSDTVRTPLSGTCANSQTGGGYVHGTARFCAASADADALDDFADTCWQPECSRFCLGHSLESYRGGNIARPVNDFRESWIVPRFYDAEDLWVLQLLARSSSALNFQIGRQPNGGPSLASLCGRFAGEVPGGLGSGGEDFGGLGVYPSRWRYFGASFLRVDVITVDGDQDFRVVEGAWVAEASADMASAPPLGTLASEIGSSLTARDDARGETVSSSLRGYVPNAGRTSVVDYTSGSATMGFRPELRSTQQLFVTSFDPSSAEDSSLASEIRARFDA